MFALNIADIFPKFEPQGFVRMLPTLGIGMLSIILVMGVIILLTMALNHFPSDKKAKK